MSLWNDPLAENNREIIFALCFSSIVPIFKLALGFEITDVLLGMLSRWVNNPLMELIVNIWERIRRHLLRFHVT